ncbi:MAG: DUF4465 domain-containing protein, partial [Planctomycetota bacterium]
SWEFVELSGMAGAASIAIEFEGSDVGKFGLNTPVYVAIDELFLSRPPALGDVNKDGEVNLLDIAPFVDLLTNQEYREVADINMDGMLDLLDVAPFVDLIAS